jgi:hypothetical protein
MEGGGEIGGPRPVGLEAELRAACVEGQAGGDVQQPVAQALGFAAGEFVGEQQALGPGDEVVGDQDELQPDAVVLEVSERQIPEAGVLVVADVVLDAGAGAVAALDRGDVSVGLVGEDRLEAMPVVVGEAQLGTGVRTLAAHDHPRIRRPAGQVEGIGDLGDLPVGALGAVLIERCNPGILGQIEDCGPDRLGEVIADRVADAALAAPVQQLVRCARAVDAQQDLDLLDVLCGDLRSAASATAI